MKEPQANHCKCGPDCEATTSGKCSRCGLTYERPSSSLKIDIDKSETARPQVNDYIAAVLKQVDFNEAAVEDAPFWNELNFNSADPEYGVTYMDVAKASSEWQHKCNQLIIAQLAEELDRALGVLQQISFNYSGGGAARRKADKAISEFKGRWAPFREKSGISTQGDK